MRSRLRSEEGYVLALVMLVLMAVGIMSATLLTQVQMNQQHVQRDRAYSQSLAVAEAGLNQYLWMVAAGTSSEANDFAIPGNTGDDPRYKVFTLTDPYSGEVQGQYAVQVTPPDQTDSRVKVTVTGLAAQPVEAPRTVEAHLGRPSFSEYILLVDESVYIGGPSDRVWHGKTHSNTGIRIETENIIDSISCANSTYEYGNDNWKAGIWSQNLPSNSASKSFWHFPVPPIDFDIVTSDFARLNSLATGDANLPYVSASGGWHIKILTGNRYQVRKVASDSENKSSGGSITYAAGSSWSAARNYPNKGVIYVNDDVWVEGAGVSGRLTIACSGQLNPSGQQTATNISIVDDITYATKDGNVAIGLIAQNNIKIPMYAPISKLPPSTNDDLEIDAAIIAQQGKEYVSYDSSGSASGWGPRRGELTFFGSVSSYITPYRRTDTRTDGHYAGFATGVNTYDAFLLHNPPPYFPKIGTYQILDWNELPSSEAVPFD